MNQITIKRAAPGVGKVYYQGKYLGNVYKTALGWQHGHMYGALPTRKAAAANLIAYLVYGEENEI